MRIRGYHRASYYGRTGWTGTPAWEQSTSAPNVNPPSFSTQVPLIQWYSIPQYNPSLNAISEQLDFPRAKKQRTGGPEVVRDAGVNPPLFSTHDPLLYWSSIPQYNPFVNSLSDQLHIPQAKKRKTGGSEAVRDAMRLLQNEFDLQHAASEGFPPKITSSHIRASINAYENEISAASQRSVYCCCGMFCLTADIYRIGVGNECLTRLKGIFDNCGRQKNLWSFCTSCHVALRRGIIPKLSALNSVNFIICQHYPGELEGLILTEDCLVAKCHPIGTILKLRPGKPAAYNALRGHMIVVPQNPGPLLQILPNPELRLSDHIKVF